MARRIGLKAFLILAVLAAFTAFTWAAEVQGDLTVEVIRTDIEKPVKGATVKVIDKAEVKVPVQMVTGDDGKAHFTNLVLGDYYVEVKHPDFADDRSLIKINADIQNSYKAYLDLPGAEKVITSKEDRLLVNGNDPKDGAVTRRDREFLQTRIAEGDSVQGILTTVPGLQRDANGQTHARGEHKSVTFSVDGVTVPVPLSNSTSNPLDPEFLENLEVRTGNYDASQGGQIGVVLNAVTQGGYKKPFVELEQKIGTQGTYQTILKAGGSNDAGDFSYFFGAKKSITDAAFEAPNPDHPTLNNHGDTTSLMLRLNKKTDEDDFGLNFSFQAGNYGLPQTPENYAAGVRQEQADGNTLFLLSWKRKLNADADLQMGLSYLNSRQATSNNGVFTKFSTFDAGVSPDLAAAGLPSNPENFGNPYLPSTNLNVRQIQPSITYTERLGEKERISAGLVADFVYSHQQVDIIDAGGGGGLPGGVPHFSADVARNAFLGGMFFSHTFPIGDQIMVNYGLRADTFNNGINVNTGQISPLVNLSWAPSPKDAIRLSYNRVFQAPPLELDVSGSTYVLPQRISIYELSYERQLASNLVAKVAYVRKDYKDQVDNGLLVGNSQIPLYGPVNFAAATYSGYELSLNTSNKYGWNGFLTATVSQAIPTKASVFDDGLPAFNDHDQRVQATAGVSYTWDNGFTMATDVYYGSGYPLDSIAAYNAVGISPYGYSGERHGRFQQNLSFNYFPAKKDGVETAGPDFGGGLQIINLWDDRSVQNYFSSFSGTRFTLPRRVLANFVIHF